MKNKNTGRYILRIFGALFLLYGLGLLLIGKGGDMIPIWLGLCAGCALLSLKKCYDAVFSRAWLKELLAICVVIVALFAVVIVVFGSRALPPEASDYILVLGAQIEGEEPSKTLRYRLDAAYEYLMVYKDTEAILSGGQAENEVISEAEAMRRYLVGRGIEDSRLILEDRSSDTYENIRNCAALLGEQKNAKLCIVSSGYHLLRSKILADKLGVETATFGAPSPIALIPNSYLREMLAIVKDIVIH